MNEIIRSIEQRRSVRQFQQKQIREEHLQAILQAGRYAPSAVNAQDWHFLAIQNKQTLDRLNEIVKGIYAQSGEARIRERGLDAQYSFFYRAPAFVIVSYKRKTRSTAPLADCACALQNMFLAAHSLGIGSCWIKALTRLDSESAVQQFLGARGVPKGNRIYGCAALGYPQGDLPPTPARKSGNILILE